MFLKKDISHLLLRFFVLFFHFHLMRVLEVRLCIWSLGILSVFTQTPNFNIDLVKNTNIQGWIRIYGIHIKYQRSRILFSIARGIGVLVALDKTTNSKKKDIKLELLWIFICQKYCQISFLLKWKVMLLMLLLSTKNIFTTLILLTILAPSRIPQISAINIEHLPKPLLNLQNQFPLHS